MPCLIFHVWRAASSSKTDCVRVWMSIDTLPPKGGHAGANGCRVSAGIRTSPKSLHFGQIEIERLGDVAQRVIVLVGDRIETRHCAHFAEWKVLDAVESLPDFFLHVVGKGLAVEHRVVPDRR